MTNLSSNFLFTGMGKKIWRFSNQMFLNVYGRPSLAGLCIAKGDFLFPGDIISHIESVLKKEVKSRPFNYFIMDDPGDRVAICFHVANYMLDKKSFMFHYVIMDINRDWFFVTVVIDASIDVHLCVEYFNKRCLKK